MQTTLRNLREGETPVCRFAHITMNGTAMTNRVISSRFSGSVIDDDWQNMQYRT